MQLASRFPWAVAKTLLTILTVASSQVTLPYAGRGQMNSFFCFWPLPAYDTTDLSLIFLYIIYCIPDL